MVLQELKVSLLYMKGLMVQSKYMLLKRLPSIKIGGILVCGDSMSVTG